jgi:hypothetical protein
MRRPFLAGVFVLALAGTVLANPVFESITVAATAVGLSSATYSGKQACEFRLETAQVRYRFDGTDPTSAEGVLLEVGDVVSIPNIAAARQTKFIRTGATSGTLKGHCW